MPQSEMQQLLDAKQAALDRHQVHYHMWRFTPTLSNAIARDKARHELSLFGNAAIHSGQRVEQAIDAEHEKWNTRTRSTS